MRFPTPLDLVDTTQVFCWRSLKRRLQDEGEEDGIKFKSDTGDFATSLSVSVSRPNHRFWTWQMGEGCEIVYPWMRCSFWDIFQHSMSCRVYSWLRRSHSWCDCNFVRGRAQRKDCIFRWHQECEIQEADHAGRCDWDGMRDHRPEGTNRFWKGCRKGRWKSCCNGRTYICRRRINRV